MRKTIGKQILIASVLGLASINAFAGKIDDVTEVKEVHCEESDRLIKVALTTAMSSLVGGPIGMVTGIPLGSLIHYWECKDEFEKREAQLSGVQYQFEKSTLVFQSEPITVAYFDHNDAEPLHLTSSLKFIHPDSIKSIDVVGHTSRKGLKSYNDELGIKRAMSVAKYLFEERKVEPSKITLYSKGEDVASNDDTPETNRRVEIHITYKDEFIF